jgi:transposase-like protein
MSATRREEVRALLESGITQAEAARRLGVTPATVCYHARALGVPLREDCARRYDWKIVQEYYDDGHSARDCKRRFGFSSQTWHEAVRRGAIVTRPQAAPIEIFLVSGRRTSRTHLKRRLLAEGLKENRCERCGIDSWLGQPLSMALHHVNGDGLDNRLENLVLLCPNCHAQTPNFSGRNRKIGRLEVVRAA